MPIETIEIMKMAKKKKIIICSYMSCSFELENNPNSWFGVLVNSIL
jgi:hypothetical protein